MQRGHDKVGRGALASDSRDWHGANPTESTDTVEEQYMECFAKHVRSTPKLLLKLSVLDGRVLLRQCRGATPMS